MTTATIAPSLQAALNAADPNELADILRLIKLGNILTPLKRTFTALTGAATYNLTALDATGETVGVANPNRLALLALRTLRVTAATTGTTVGVYALVDSGGAALTPNTSSVVGLAIISDDGTTLTFPSADVTAFVIEYVPQSASSMTTVPKGSGIGSTP
jgi:hypothetical protein